MTSIAPIALAIAFAGAAYAGGADLPSGTLSAGYAYGLNDGTSNIYGANGTLQIPVDLDWAAKTGFEAVGGYHRPDSGGMDFWYLGGALYAGGEPGRVAANYTYHNMAGQGIHAYGAGAEWFVAPNATLAVRGGGLSRDHIDGGYVGAQGTWYLIPDFALSAGVDHLSVGYHETGETIQAEWLPSQTTPISIYAGYQHLDYSVASADLIFAGVKLYLNGDGAATLADRQRQGTNGYIVQSPKDLDQY
ncbi:MAG TPA: hypothetical protein VGC27_13985 [Rhizomicrobium sp.]